MGRTERDKGARGERELVKILNDYGLKVHRGYVQLRQSDLVWLEGIHVECKRVEKLNIWKAMEQAVEEAEKRQDGRPTVFFRRNREDWLVCMRLPEWVEIYKAWEEADERSDKPRQEDP